jgi:prepilin-type N-terminal cleavage/methylation domain-containing protein
VTDRTGEAGFTLIEMLLTMTLLTLLIIPFSAGIYLGLHTEGDVQARLAESNSAGQFSSYFVPDVQQSLVATLNGMESGVICGGAAQPVGLLLTLVPNASSVSYFVDPSDPTVLRRRACENGAVTGPPAGIPVIRHLSGSPLFSCAPNADCSSFETVTASLAQLVAGKNPYTTSVSATRRIR